MKKKISNLFFIGVVIAILLISIYPLLFNSPHSPQQILEGTTNFEYSISIKISDFTHQLCRDNSVFDISITLYYDIISFNYIPWAIFSNYSYKIDSFDPREDENNLGIYNLFENTSMQINSKLLENRTKSLITLPLTMIFSCITIEDIIDNLLNSITLVDSVNWIKNIEKYVNTVNPYSRLNISTSWQKIHLYQTSMTSILSGWSELNDYYDQGQDDSVAKFQLGYFVDKLNFSSDYIQNGNYNSPNLNINNNLTVVYENGLLNNLNLNLSMKGDVNDKDVSIKFQISVMRNDKINQFDLDYNKSRDHFLVYLSWYYQYYLIAVITIILILVWKRKITIKWI